MTDLVTTARTARERLSVGLNALQDPSAPEALQSAAEPIAQAMSSLLQIERTGALPINRGGPNVLDLVRSALAKLQTLNIDHPSLFQAMEAVAGSLGLVYGLAQRVSSVPPTGSASTSSSPQRLVASPAVAAAPRVAPMQPVPTSPQRAVAPSGQPAASVPRPATGGLPVASIPRPQRSTPVEGAKVVGSSGPGTLVSRQAASAAVSSVVAAAMQKPPAGETPMASAQTMVAHEAPVRKSSPGAATPVEVPAAGKMPSSPPTLGRPVAAATPAAAPVAPTPVAPTAQGSDGGGPVQRVAAELGAHSATNFYKGLSGNDVVDSGGIFIATYQIPPIGQNLIIRVSLPGGYEFEAKGIVRWTREASPTSGGEAISPGFGAQFTEISLEARQLVYRYARNREPLFHDDF
jgi:hypothetical protein